MVDHILHESSLFGFKRETLLFGNQTFSELVRCPLKHVWASSSLEHNRAQLIEHLNIDNLHTTKQVSGTTSNFLLMQ